MIIGEDQISSTQDCQLTPSWVCFAMIGFQLCLVIYTIPLGELYHFPWKETQPSER